MWPNKQLEKREREKTQLISEGFGRTKKQRTMNEMI